MQQIMAIAERRRLAVVEDSAQAVGATFDGIKGGAWGWFGCFSFYPAKILGAAGDGGLVSCKSKVLGDESTSTENSGRVGKDMLALYGYNSRLDNLQAAILNVKLARLPAWLERRALAACRGLARRRGADPARPARRRPLARRFAGTS